jgi:glycerophosphoryl diester phosphodiesterase
VRLGVLSRALRPAVWSHRGRVGREDTAAENTPAAFLAASAAGAEGIELDVWRAADGAWVVHHDRVSAWGPLDTLGRPDIPADIPDLAEALAACRVQTVNVELKVPEEAPAPLAGRLGRELARALVELPGRGDGPRLVLSSFSRPAADAAARAAPDLRVGLLLEGRWQHSEVGAQASGYWALHVGHGALDSADVARLHQKGFKVVAWTVDDGAEVQRLATAGVDVLITNQVTLALQLLDELCR